jgi:hypothetical protein
MYQLLDSHIFFNGYDRNFLHEVLATVSKLMRLRHFGRRRGWCDLLSPSCALLAGTLPFTVSRYFTWRLKGTALFSEILQEWKKKKKYYWLCQQSFGTMKEKFLFCNHVFGVHCYMQVATNSVKFCVLQLINNVEWFKAERKKQTPRNPVYIISLSYLLQMLLYKHICTLPNDMQCTTDTGVTDYTPSARCYVVRRLAINQ